MSSERTARHCLRAAGLHPAPYIIVVYENGRRDRYAALGARGARAGSRKITGAAGSVHHDFRPADRSPLHARLVTRRRLRARSQQSRRISVYARHSPDRLSRPALDHAPVRRLRHAGRDERTLQGAAQGRWHRPERRLRSADVDGPRSGSRALARRSGEVRRQHRVARRHGTPLRRDRAWRDHDVDDDQLARADDLRDVPRRCRAAGRRLDDVVRDDSERHPERVHRAEGVHLSAARVDAPGDRRLRLLQQGSSQVEHRLGERVPHSRSGIDGPSGAGVHAARRHRVRPIRDRCGSRRRRFRAAHLVLLQLTQRLLRGDCQVPRGTPALGRSHARSVRCAARAVLEAAFPHADGRRVADRATALQQRRPHGPAGPRRGARGHPVAPHELARRSAGAADRRGRDTGPPDAADHRARERRHQCRRPAGRIGTLSSG